MPGTTPVYGFPYPEPTDLVADYPALGQDLAEDIEAVLPTIGGLVAAPPTSIANTGGSASLSGNTVTFTGVSAVSLNSCFVSNYDRYRILISGSLASGIQRLRFALRLAGTTATTNMESIAAETTSAGVSAKSQATGDIGNAAVDGFSIAFDVFSPNLAAATFGTVNNSARQAGVNFWNWNGSWVHTTATAYDGFTLTPASSTMTGTVAVFGYRK